MAPPFDSQVGEHNSSNCWTYGRYIELVHGPTSHLITGGKHQPRHHMVFEFLYCGKPNNKPSPMEVYEIGSWYTLIWDHAENTPVSVCADKI